MSDSIISQVKAFCAKERGNSKKLSEAMGYKTVQTVYAWRNKGAIPEAVRSEVKAALAKLKSK